MFSQPYRRNRDTNLPNRVVPRKRCLKNRFKSFTQSATIVCLLLLCLPSKSVGWWVKIPFLETVFPSQENSDAKIHEIAFDKQPSAKPIVNNEKIGFRPVHTLGQASDKDVTVPTGNSSLLVVGGLIFGGLVIISLFLYALDVYATSRIDRFLYDYYGPELYDRYTSVYDPTDYFSSSNTNGYYSATTASQYYGGRRFDEVI